MIECACKKCVHLLVVSFPLFSVLQDAAPNPPAHTLHLPRCELLWGAACFTCVQVLSAPWMAWVDFCLGGGLLRSRLASLRLGPFLGRMPNPPGYEGGLCLALDATSIASFLMNQGSIAARPYLALGPCFAFALLYFSQPSCFCSLALFFRAFTSASALLPLGLCSPRPLPFEAG